MARCLRWSLLLVCLALIAPAGASAAEPPWCGTPEPDYSADVLPDGTDLSDPPGSFPHIPHYAIGCTLEDIRDRSSGRMRLDVIGESALGRKLYSVVINDLRTRQQQRAYINWLSVREVMLSDPERAQRMLDRLGDDVKVPVFVQAGIHGNEYEGVDSSIDLIEKFATTPRGEDPAVDAVLDHAVVIFNPIQNPDGRVFGTRENGNAFDLNRDYLTQSQPETIASVELMKRWLAPEVLDLHGYLTPTLIEATTKPHNPSIEYDLWLKWNQARIDVNEAALNAIGQQVQRPINDWCPEADLPNANGLCDGGETPGPDVAEGWDDWGPFYTAMYAQHVGLDSSTVEMCQSVTLCGGRAGARRIQSNVQESTLAFVIEHRAEMLHDMLEIYIRADNDAERPDCCPEPFDPEFHNWMQDYPQAYVIPVGEGQRSDAEANRLVEWLLFNDIEVHKLRRDAQFGGRTFDENSYVVFMAQPRRGLADTALGAGVDISSRIQRLYAAPAAWSHGSLWGADTVTIPDGARFKPPTERIERPTRLRGSVPSGTAAGYTLEIDSPTAVRAVNELVGAGVEASIALESFSGGAAGTAVFGGDRDTREALQAAARETGLDFAKLQSGALPDLEPIERVPRIKVFSAASTPPPGSTSPNPRPDQSVWVLRELGFEVQQTSVAQLNTAATDPLAGFDLIYNAASNYPANTSANATARSRLAAFFAAGGGYIGGQANGANFLSNGGQIAGLTAANAAGNGRSGIILWNNAGGRDSVVTGAMPEQDTAIVDPPTWLTAVPSSWSVDGRLPQSGFFVAGLWPTATQGNAPGSAVIAHGTNTAGTSRLTVFANNPLYRADPEREWPMVATAAYWADR
jgi:hypothetical protein